MLQLSMCRIQTMIDLPLNNLAVNNSNGNYVEEGSALQYQEYNGYAAVTPSTGTAGYNFAGVAWGFFMRPSSAVFVDVLTVPTVSPYTVTLSQSPNNLSAITVAVGTAPSNNATLYTQTSGTPTGNEYSIGGLTNQVLTFPSTSAGMSFVVTYSYNLTVLQAQSFTGDGYIANPPSNVTNSIGVIQKGIIFTSKFDTSVYWGNVSSVNLGPNGIFTSGGSGPAVNAIVYALPNTEVPYLGLNIVIA